MVRKRALQIFVCVTPIKQYFLGLITNFVAPFFVFFNTPQVAASHTSFEQICHMAARRYLALLTIVALSQYMGWGCVHRVKAGQDLCPLCNVMLAAQKIHPMLPDVCKLTFLLNNVKHVCTHKGVLL